MTNEGVERRELRRLRDLAKELAEDGYGVEIEPSPQKLPAELRAYRPDLVAFGPDGNLVIEVKSSATLRGSEGRLTGLAKVVAGMSGWRYDLVVTNPSDPEAGDVDERAVPGDRYEKMRAAYRFLRARNGSTVSVSELSRATGWSETTTRTYISKTLRPWLARLSAGTYQVSGVASLSEDRFLTLQSQVRGKEDTEAQSLRARLDEALRRLEGPHIEFKEAIPQNAQSLRREIAAFATNGGGQIYLGIRDDGTVAGLAGLFAPADRSAFREQVEGIARGVDPAVAPEVTFIEYEGSVVCLVDVPNGPEPVYYVENRPYVRIGSASRPARPDEVKMLIQSATAIPTEDVLERHRPLFGRVPGGGLRRLEREFEPSWRIEHLGGDTPPIVAWRFRGPRFGGTGNEFHQTSPTALSRTHVGGTFNLASQVVPDPQVGEDEIGWEIRFDWLGKARYQLQR